MKVPTFNKSLKKIRDYGRLFGIKIILKKDVENHYNSLSRSIMVDSNEPYDRIINILLHEIGHHHDDSLHPKETDSSDLRMAYGKMEQHDHEVDLLKKRRLDLASKIEEGPIRDIIIKIAEDRDIYTSKAENRLLKEFRGDKKNWLTMRQRKIITHPYRYFSKECYLTLLQREKVIEVETRAWEYGEKIAKMLNIKFSKSFYKQKTQSIKTYKENVLVIDPLYKL